MKTTSDPQVVLQLHDRMIINTNAVRNELDIDTIIERGVTGENSNEEQLILQLDAKQIITDDEVRKYFGVTDEEKRDEPMKK